MGNKRLEFTPEFKDEAVKLVVNTGRPVAVAARELGIVEQTLGNWYNNERLHSFLGNVPPEEYERDHYARTIGPSNGEAANKPAA